MAKVRKSYYREVNIARGMAVLFVLLGHSFPDVQTGMSSQPAAWIVRCMYSFHMGLFFFLSGFVSAPKFYGGTDLKEEMQKKVKRLLIPYFFISLITMGIKPLFAVYANNPLDFKYLWYIFLGDSPNGGVWYLWNLFVISMAAGMLGNMLKSRSSKVKSIVLLGVGIFMYVLLKLLPGVIFYNLLRYTVFYGLGVVCHYYYDWFKTRLSGNMAAILALLAVVVFSCPYISMRADYLLTGILGTYGVFVLSRTIAADTESRLFGFLNLAGNYSYDIYMISYFVQVPIRVVCWSILKLPYWMIVALMLLPGFVFSYIIAKYIVRKTGLLRKLVIGDWT